MFSAQLPELFEGRHTLAYSVGGGTFARAHRHTLDVLWPLEITVDENQEGNKGVHLISIEPREDVVDINSLGLDV